MKKGKYFISTLLAISLVLSLCVGFASANVHASDYLNDYCIFLSAGDSAGALDVEFDVTAVFRSDSVGVSQIKIYRSNGLYITTIFGSTTNKLLRENAISNVGTYTYYGVSGKDYYAVVTVYAERDGGYDTREITTAVVTAP